MMVCIGSFAMKNCELRQVVATNGKILLILKNQAYCGIL